MNTEDLEEFIDDFKEESIELLEAMESYILQMQKNGIDKETVAALFRAVHTIKGSCAVFELEHIVKFAHIAENLLDDIRHDKIAISDEILSLYLQTKDHLQELVLYAFEHRQTPPEELQAKTQAIAVELAYCLKNGKAKEQEYKQEIAPKDEPKEPMQEVALEPQVENTQDSSTQKTQEQKSITTLRVEAHKIDTLINLIGEMVIANSNVMQQVAMRGDKQLMESVSVVSRMLEEIREASMQTRMVPIGETFSRFKRVVHDLSKELNKTVELTIIGGDTELDKTVIEKIYDPLIHLVRNSLDHGIEKPEARKEKGKSATGHLTLKAYHEAGSIAIQVIDDGKGLNPDVIKAKAIQKQLIDSNTELSNKDIFALIMTAGFSTAEQISNISGRGVGMDVVKRNIEELRGTIELDSIVDVGTTTTIRLPLTLAIIDGFLTKVGNAFFVVPLDMIVECIELTDRQRSELANNNYINLRGSILPVLNLRDYLDINCFVTKRENIVIVKYAEQTMGIIVNELHGEYQTVIKPLGVIFEKVRGIGGATILGSGEVALILDIPMLMQCITNPKSVQG